MAEAIWMVTLSRKEVAEEVPVAAAEEDECTKMVLVAMEDVEAVGRGPEEAGGVLMEEVT